MLINAGYAAQCEDRENERYLHTLHLFLSIFPYFLTDCNPQPWTGITTAYVSGVTQQEMGLTRPSAKRNNAGNAGFVDTLGGAWLSAKWILNKFLVKFLVCGQRLGLTP